MSNKADEVKAKAEEAKVKAQEATAKAQELAKKIDFKDKKVIGGAVGVGIVVLGLVISLIAGGSKGIPDTTEGFYGTTWVLDTSDNYFDREDAKITKEKFDELSEAKKSMRFLIEEGKLTKMIEDKKDVEEGEAWKLTKKENLTDTLQLDKKLGAAFYVYENHICNIAKKKICFVQD